MNKASWRWVVLGGVSLVLAAVGAVLYFGNPVGNQYDKLFAQIRVGMSQVEVEAVLGPPTGPPNQGDTLRLLAGKTFDDIDSPPVSLTVVKDYWYNGQDRRIRVEYVDGKVWRAKINGPGFSRLTGP
ncbi:MAG: hypothetical protein ACRC8S_02455 [Fimbriiglobus sp.]